MPLDTLAFATGRELNNSVEYGYHNVTSFNTAELTQEITFPAEYT